MKVKVHLYTRFERFWHWFQAFLIIFLLVTGFEVHGTVRIFGYGAACYWHNLAGLTLLILTSFAIFWHLTTGQWRHYQPTFVNLQKIGMFYCVGIMRGEPHPFHKSKERKLNPLQALSYFFLKVVLLPLQLVSGLIYYLYNDWLNWGLTMRLDGVAMLHTAMAFILLIFLIVHIYLSTTGGSLITYIAAMITGWEEIEEES
ncbi:MAG: cytochrome b/b6 domain-containing protein [Deltaproteobacteria bacterium]|nr:cytochrome b/b6 domain-containing protein [Deltaproteobacteria bacterium]